MPESLTWKTANRFDIRAGQYLIEKLQRIRDFQWVNSFSWSVYQVVTREGREQRALLMAGFSTEAAAKAYAEQHHATSKGAA